MPSSPSLTRRIPFHPARDLPITKIGMNEGNGIVEKATSFARPAGHLRIVSWNCAGALQRKWSYLLALQPDIAVIPEACNPQRLGYPSTVPDEPGQSEWIGRLQHKGLAAFSFGDWKLTRHPQCDERLEWILPLAVTGPIDFTLIGVWSMNHRASQPVPEGLPRSQPLAAAELYDFEGERGRLAVVGDFNSAPQWDKPSRPKFANMIKRYSEVGLCSAYHRLADEPFGAETKPTHWWRDRKIDGPRYHIDYAFIPEAWVESADLDVGGFEQWVKVAGSDHAPLILDIDLSRLTPKPAVASLEKLA